MSCIPENYPPFLADLAAAIALELAEQHPFEPAAAEEIAFRVAEHVRANYGGLNMYVPKGDAFDLGKRDWQIYAEHTGRPGNLAELALKYDLSEMRIRQIVKACRTEEMRRRQAPLFPEPK